MPRVNASFTRQIVGDYARIPQRQFAGKYSPCNNAYQFSRICREMQKTRTRNILISLSLNQSDSCVATRAYNWPCTRLERPVKAETLF